MGALIDRILDKGINDVMVVIEFILDIFISPIGRTEIDHMLV